MKLFEFLKRRRAQCKQIASSIFDSNDPETAAEQFIKSTEIDNSGLFEEANKPIDVSTPLYDAPNIDYYMENNETSSTKQMEETEKTQEETTVEKSLEEPACNDSYSSLLMEELAHLLEELHRLSSQTDDENAMSVISFCENRMVEIMISCGCEAIDKDAFFDNSRHVTSPFSFVENGCRINKIMKPGLSYKNKVLVKAIVECNK